MLGLKDYAPKGYAGGPDSYQLASPSAAAPYSAINTGSLHYQSGPADSALRRLCLGLVSHTAFVVNAETGAAAEGVNPKAIVQAIVRREAERGQAEIMKGMQPVAARLMKTETSPSASQSPGWKDWAASYAPGRERSYNEASFVSLTGPGRADAPEKAYARRASGYSLAGLG